MAFCKLLTLLVLIHNTGDLFGAEVRSSIVGGENAPFGKWPWMVHLNITSDGKIRWRCGGTILTRDWVLTAASCFDDQLKPNYQRSMAWVGSHSLKKGFHKFMGIFTAILHEKYQNLGGRYINNIALVKLKKNIEFLHHVRPVSLPSVDDSFDSSSECWITGWGYIGTEDPLPAPETLQQLKIPINSPSECKKQYPELTSDMLCAGETTGGKDACTGDYGGPLVCRAAGGFVQVGIMSYGNPGGCALPGRSGVYTQVSKYLGFINDYINHNEEASTEV